MNSLRFIEAKRPNSVHKVMYRTNNRKPCLHLLPNRNWDANIDMTSLKCVTTAEI